MFRMLRSEWVKLGKSRLWLLVFVSPMLAALIGYAYNDVEPAPWDLTMNMMSAAHAYLFLPLMTGVFAAFVCRYEHVGGGWKQLLSLPVSRTNVYVAKFALTAGLLAATQLLFLAGLLLIGLLKGFPAPIPWESIGRSVFGGWVACLPLAALQLAVSTAWSSFAAPMAVNVIFTLPNILVANSEKYGPYYPWAQPMIAMASRDVDNFGAFNVPLETLLIVILGSFVLFFVSGLVSFHKRAY